MQPKLIWSRTQTIGRGDDCCSFLLQYQAKLAEKKAKAEAKAAKRK